MYAKQMGDSSVADFDIQTLLNAAEGAAEDLVSKAEAAVGGAAENLVSTGQQSVSTAVDRLINGAPQSAPTGQPSSAPQAQETPVAGRTPGATSTSNVMNKAKELVKTYGVAAAAGTGLFLWKKSILWAVGGAVGAHLIAKKMRKGGS